MRTVRNGAVRWAGCITVWLLCVGGAIAATETIAFFPLDLDPGWTTEGAWAFGVPQGQGSGAGDPAAGFTGTNVYGYNLDGDYADNLPARYLVTESLNCAAYDNVSLVFRRWLGIESASFDHAAVQASSNGTDWVTLWSHEGGTFWDSDWTEITLDLSAIADRQPAVRVRWSMGPTDGSITYPGWNIDDIRFEGDRVDDLLVMPAPGIGAVGYENGVIIPSNVTYQIVNASSNAVTWKAGNTEAWLAASPATGTVPPGETNVVQLYFTSAAYLLPTGRYEDVVVILNTGSGFAHERLVRLEVRVDPGEIDIIDTAAPSGDRRVPFGALIVGTSRTETVVIRNTNPLYNLVISDLSFRGMFWEDFNDGDDEGWAPTDTGAWSVVDGEYAARSSADTYMTSLYAADTFDDLAASVRLRREGSAASAAGIALRTTGDFDPNTAGSGYMFSIALNGFYSIWKQVDGAFEWIQPWSASGAISNGTNVLTASIAGTTLQLFVNGYLAWTGTDSTFSSGHIALGGYTAPDYTTAHYFDDVTVTDPVPSGGTPGSRQTWYNRNQYTTGNPVLAPEAPVPEYPGAENEVPAGTVGPLATVFAVSNMPAMPLALAPGATQTLEVTYTPVSLRSDDALLRIYSNDADEPEIEIVLTGSGILDTLHIPAGDAFEPAGHPGGPFTPPQIAYAVTNIGTSPLDWQAIPDAAWLTVTPADGSLAPGQGTQVTVALADATRTFGAGLYTAAVLFSNRTTRITQSRTALLTIFTAPEVTLQPSAFSITNVQGTWSRRALTVGNTGDAPLTFTVRGRETARPPAPPAVKGILPPDYDRTGGGPKSAYVPNQLLVRFKEAVKGAAKAQLVKALGGETVLREYRIVPGLCLVSLGEKSDVQTALKAFNKDAAVLYAEPNYRVKALETHPDDTRFGELWGLHNTGQSGGTPDADIDAPQAWDLHTGSPNIVVAVIDTGVDYNHVDLDDNMWVNPGEIPGNDVDDDNNGYIDDIHGYDVLNNDGDPIDDHGHGSHVSGTIGAEGNNAEGVAGVCWDVRIMALKFLDSFGNGDTANAVLCVEYAALMGAHVLNNSWGGGPYEQSLKDAIDAAGAQDILFVAAAGNDYGNDNDLVPHYPSNYDSPNVISVMSTDRNDGRSSFSNYGLTSVDLAAPGSDILSCGNGGGYQLMNGTSMATPHVAGACALMMAANPLASADRIKEALLLTADQTLGGQCVSGGRLSLAAAVTEIGVPWIRVEPAAASDLAPLTSVDLAVTFDASFLPPGVYEGEVRISAPGAVSPSVAAPVIFTVLSNDLVVRPDAAFESAGYWSSTFAPGSTSYVVSNAGTASLEWTVPDTVAWLDIAPATGILAPGATDTVAVVVNGSAAGLPPSLYTDTLVFSNESNTAIVTRDVSLDVRPSPTTAVYVVSLDADPGWPTPGQWAFGEPQGGGSHNGDPTSGFTGTNVYGYNLDGDYSNNSAVSYLVSEAFDCSDYREVALSFRRWLGVEHPTFDRATVDVSTNGTVWTPVWLNAGTISDAAWVSMQYDISAAADEQPTVYLRWGMGPTDDSFTYPGWNIDDIVLSGRYIDHYVLTIESAHGLSVPGVGSNVFARGAVTTVAVVDSPVAAGGEQYDCVGWTGAGSVPASGRQTNTGPIELTADSTLTWLWQTNVWLDTVVTGHGSVDTSDGWFGTTAGVTVTAMPGDYAAFDYWSGDTNGATTVSNRITVTMNMPRQVVAHFDEFVTSHGTPWWWLASYGLTNGGFELQADGDADGDGMQTWEEWLAGTIPTNQMSVLRVADLPAESGGRRRLTFQSVPGRSYRIVSCADLTVATWLPEAVGRSATGILSAAPLEAVGNSVTVYLVPGDAARFYRVFVEVE